MAAAIDFEDDLPAPGMIEFVAMIPNGPTTTMEVVIIAVLPVAALDPVVPMVVVAETLPVMGLALEAVPVRNAFLGAMGEIVVPIITRFDGRIARINSRSGR